MTSSQPSTQAGLMLATFAEVARVLERDDDSTELAEVYRVVAVRNAGFLLNELRTPDGRLVHTWRAGVAKGNGFLADYAHLIEGLLELYQTTSHSCLEITSSRL